MVLSLKGVCFHFAKAVIKRVRTVGLVIAFRNDATVLQILSNVLTDVSHLIIGSARCAEQELILSCLFLISFYLNVLLFL